MLRIQICGLRDKEKPTSLDYKCNSCPRAFTSPIGLATHMFVKFTFELHGVLVWLFYYQEELSRGRARVRRREGRDQRR